MVYVRSYMVDHVCGFPWTDGCADFRGRFTVLIIECTVLSGNRSLVSQFVSAIVTSRTSYFVYWFLRVVLLQCSGYSCDDYLAQQLFSVLVLSCDNYQCNSSFVQSFFRVIVGWCDGSFVYWLFSAIGIPVMIIQYTLILCPFVRLLFPVILIQCSVSFVQQSFSVIVLQCNSAFAPY